MSLDPFLAESTNLQLHLLAALAALGLGGLILALRKGTRLHKALGRVWVAAMLLVAIRSFWITGLAGEGNWSMIHLLSAWTIVSLAVAIWAIRTGRRRTHAGFMVGVFLGAVGAGAGALIPGRLISQILGYA